jgi:hypothetical protein
MVLIFIITCYSVVWSYIRPWSLYMMVTRNLFFQESVE